MTFTDIFKQTSKTSKRALKRSDGGGANAEHVANFTNAGRRKLRKRRAPRASLPT